MAGFDKKGSVFIARAHVTPPDALKKQIFPKAEYWLEQIESGRAQQDLAGQGWLRLLQEMREVLLQDAPFLQGDAPNHRVWHHNLFRSIEYREWSAKLLADTENIQRQHDQNWQSMSHSHDPVLVAELQGIRTGIQGIHNMLESHQAAQVAVTATVSGVPAILQQRASTVDAHALTSPSSAQAPTAPTPSSTSTTSSAPHTPTAPTSSSPQAPTAPTSSPRDPESGTREGDAEAPVYRLSRSITTVRELWQEYAVGLAGGPPVRELEVRYGKQWRRRDAEKKFFSNRKIIYDEIEARAKKHNGRYDTAVQELEAMREMNNKSLAWLMDTIKAAQFAGGKRQHRKPAEHRAQGTSRRQRGSTRPALAMPFSSSATQCLPTAVPNCN